ncbi:hypothetical protein BJX62DRAFT_241933 [Aspergillus germanicus]
MPKVAEEIMDPDGDVVVNCSGFKEGLALRAPSSARIRATIELPSDNADAFRVFAYCAHHNIKALAPSISTDGPLELAIFLDKYGCATLLMHASQTWLEQCSEGASVDDLRQLLQAVYFLEMEPYFVQISRSLIQKRKEPFHKWAFAINNDAFVSDDLIAKLDKLKTSVARRTENALMDPVSKLDHKKCKRLKKTILEYIQTLKDNVVERLCKFMG